jgi:hypothetical protein
MPVAQQRSIRPYVFIGICLLSGVVYLGFVYRGYLRHWYLAVATAICLVLAHWGLRYSNEQGRKLANENMRKAGLKPDRD